MVSPPVLVMVSLFVPPETVLLPPVAVMKRGMPELLSAAFAAPPLRVLCWAKVMLLGSVMPSKTTLMVWLPLV